MKKQFNIFIITLLLSSPIYSMELVKELEVTKSEKRLSIESLTKEDIKRLSRELIKAETEEATLVKKNGCGCTPLKLKEFFSGAVTLIAAAGSVAATIIRIFVH